MRILFRLSSALDDRLARETIIRGRRQVSAVQNKSEDAPLSPIRLTLQFIELAPGHDRLVVIPESEFRVLERAANLNLADMERTAGLDALPPTSRRRILAGESPIRVVREWRGLRGQQVADLVGITPSMLSQIETKRKTGSVRTFKAIALVLGVPLELVFPKAAEGQSE
jgi:transcriptional regulator with XRE-family HTH domain